MTVVLLFGVLLLNPSEASTNFGLFLEDSSLSPLNYKLVNGYLNTIDERIKDGVRYGVNRLITIHFISGEMPDLGLPLCHFDGNFENQYVSIENDKTIKINSQLKEMILGHTIRFKRGGCSHQDLFVKSLEKILLKLSGVFDFDKKISPELEGLILKCENEDFENDEEENQYKVKCEEVNQFSEKRETYLDYKEKVKNILYNSARLEFDTTALSDTDLQKYNICGRDYLPTKILANGKKMKMLGMAIVYFAPGFKTSVAGHLAERYIYCLDSDLKDVMFEYTQLVKEELPGLTYVYSQFNKDTRRDYLNSLIGSIYIKVKHNPAQNTENGYGFSEFHSNRDIMEIWPKFTPLEIFDGLQISLDNFSKQKEKFKAREKFDEYSLIGNNCTTPIKERLEKYSGGELSIDPLQGLSPKWIFNFLKNKKVNKMIIYPSQRLLREFQMLDLGKSLFWENISFLSEASAGARSNGMVILYPEVHGFLKNLALRPLSGILNLGSGIVQTLLGILEAPIDWLSELPVFKNFSFKKNSFINISEGVSGIAMSFSEMLGFSLRHFGPSEWTQEEKNYLEKIAPLKDPKIVDFLFQKVGE